MEPFVAVIVLMAMAALIALIIAWSRAILNDWARQNGIEILSAEFRLFRRGPLFWTTSKGQTVYYVTARMSDGSTRRGWVRVGSFWLGLFSDKVDARWE